MKLTLTLATLGAALTTSWFAGAQATETPPRAEALATRKTIPAPRNALELSVASGYTQGFGSLKSGVGMPSVATGGVGFDLGVGYRIDPSWAILWAGQYQEFSASRAEGARGLTTTIAAQYHFLPERWVDPWVEAGGGYRFFWEDLALGPNVMTHGFQLGRLRAGIDFRADEHVAIGPVVGADATWFLFQDLPNAGTTVEDARLSTFVYAGLQGRFDIGLGRTSDASVRQSTAAR